MAKGKIWKNEEIYYLRKNYASKTTQELKIFFEKKS